MKTLERHWRYLLILPFALYGLYVVAIAAFLNSPLFGKATEMDDPQATHLRFTRAWSLIPGEIHASRIFLAIREPTVDLDIELKDVQVRIDLGKLREKRVFIPRLNAGETNVAIRMKSDQAREERIERIGKISDLERATAAEEQRRLKSRWKIEVARVELPNIPAIAFDQDRLHGAISVSGAFMLQPGTQCEIFPSRLTVQNGAWNDEIRAIDLTGDIRFHPFLAARTSGSEVFRYLDARLAGKAVAENLRFLNVTLRSLDEYGFGKANAALATTLAVKAGRLLPGSFLRTERSAIRIDGPRFDVSGQGALAWSVPKTGDHSLLRAEIRDAKADVRFGENRINGSIRRVNADLRLLGLDLANAFSGLSARLRIRDGRLAAVPVPTKAAAPKPAAEKLEYRVHARVNGELSAVAGEFPDEAGLPKPADFTIRLDRTSVRIPKFGTLEGSGAIRMAVRPIDFRFGRADVPGFQADYTGRLDGKYPLALTWTAKETSRTFVAGRPEEDRWRGSGELKIAKFDGVLDFLSATNRISGLVRAGLNATEVKSRVEWEMARDNTWLRVQDLDSNGIWSGFGTLLSEKAGKHEPAKTTAAFEGKVLGLPIGVGLKDRDLQVKILPSEAWFNEIRRP